jgi:hypothetical protein
MFHALPYGHLLQSLISGLNTRVTPKADASKVEISLAYKAELFPIQILSLCLIIPSVKEYPKELGEDMVSSCNNVEASESFLYEFSTSCSQTGMSTEIASR